MKKKLRLLVTKDCPRDCEGCCNKDWDLDSLPVVDNFDKYDEIIITGGEPLSKNVRSKTTALVDYLQIWYPDKKIIIYTADCFGLGHFLQMHDIGGITLTIHTTEDLKWFDAVNDKVLNEVQNYPLVYNERSLRLNIFKGVHIPENLDLSAWTVKDNIEWVKNCPLPEDEVFMKMPNI